MMSIDDVDWSRLEHAYGSAADIPELWAAFLRLDSIGKYADGSAADSLWAAICHQGDLFSATRALVPYLIERALCEDEPVRAAALSLLGSILRGTGILELKAQRSRAPASRFRNPVTGEVMMRGDSTSEPDPDALAAEHAWVHAMKESIESHLDAWISATKHSDSRVRLHAAHLLAGISLHPRWREAGKAVHRMLELCSDEKEREELRYIIEDMD